MSQRAQWPCRCHHLQASPQSSSLSRDKQLTSFPQSHILHWLRQPTTTFGPAWRQAPSMSGLPVPAAESWRCGGRKPQSHRGLQDKRIEWPKSANYNGMCRKRIELLGISDGTRYVRCASHAPWWYLLTETQRLPRVFLQELVGQIQLLELAAGQNHPWCQ